MLTHSSSRFGLLLTILVHSSLLFGATKPLIIAHRGAAGYLPEHTLAGAAMAYGMGADFIEPDVVLTKDRIPIVRHDIHLDETTNVATVFPDRRRTDGRWYAIDFTLQEIKQLKAHERIDIKTGKAAFATRFPEKLNLLEVPTLDELIHLIKGLNSSKNRRVGLYPEAKAPKFHREAGMDIAAILLETLTKHQIPSADLPVYFQCFDPDTLKYIHEKLSPKLPLVQLIGENEWKEADVDFDIMRSDAGMREVAKYAQGIGPKFDQILRPSLSKKGELLFVATPLVAWAKKYSLLIHPYTLRQDQLPKGIKSVDQILKALLEVAHVDGFFTDFTDTSYNYLNPKK